jgi:hypothetical protein
MDPIFEEESPRKMTLRNRFPMAIVCHNKVRRRWFERASMIQDWWFPSRVLDRQTFAADMLFNGAAEQDFPRKMGADAWFDFKGSDKYEVEEQSFLLPDDEILTVLKLPEAAIKTWRYSIPSRRAALCQTHPIRLCHGVGWRFWRAIR